MSSIKTKPLLLLGKEMIITVGKYKYFNFNVDGSIGTIGLCMWQ